MLTHNNLRKGTMFLLEGEPFEVLEFNQMKKAQRRVVIQTKIKNLITGSVFEKNFHQGDVFKEAELIESDAKFLYSHKGKFVFCEINNPAKRFELNEDQIGPSAKFLKAGQIIKSIVFKEKIIAINIPIKVQLKIIEAPPGVKGDRAQGGTKTVILETGARINAPLFVGEGDIIEVNNETQEYFRRVD